MPTDDLDQRVITTCEALQRAASEAGFTVTADLRIAEADAARLIGISPGGLKNIRNEGRGPANYIAPVAGSRISYRLLDLARWIELRREDW